MRQIKIGKGKTKRKKGVFTKVAVTGSGVYVKKPKFERKCINPECDTVFETNGKKYYCSAKCFVKVKGRKSTWPNKKKYAKEYRERIKKSSLNPQP